MDSLEPPTPSPRGKLSRLRRGRKDKDPNNSAPSLVGSSTDGDEETMDRKMSSEGFMDKLKDRRRKSTDDNLSAVDSGKRLSKLIPGKMKSRRRSSNNANDSRRSSTISDDGGNISSNASQVSIGRSGSGHSSLLTDDSDTEGRPTRPSLSPRDSHAGYLTLSSPLIKIQTSDSADATTDTPEVIPLPSSAIPSHPSTITTAEHSGQAEPSDPSRSPIQRAEVEVIASRRKSVDTSISRPLSLPGSLSEIGSVSADTTQKSDKPGRAAAPEPSAKNDTVLSGRRSSLTASSKLPIIDTAIRPATPPNLVDTPSTLVTPPTPTLAQGESPPKNIRSTAGLTQSKPTLSPAKSSSNPKPSFRGRPKSASIGASKLSNAISSAPLTPPIEESKTPGGSFISPSGSSGFFSSVFSAAQNAANQLSTSINTSISQNQKGKVSLPHPTGESSSEQVIPGVRDLPPTEEFAEQVTQPAIETLGQGELSLGHLGISDTETSPMTSTLDLAERTAKPSSTQQDEENDQKAEESAAARAVSAAYDKPISTAVSQATGGRPPSIVSGSELGTDQSPPRASIAALESNEIHRSGSVRSRISDRARRRHRGSSATTGGTLAAVISSANATLANPSSAASGTGHRLTGFAVASSKRNKDFHQLFRSVPEDDYLIEDYSAALQRDILLHGRFYVSEGHVCFSSNILGWVTNLVISFDEIVSVEKKNTAIVFPNAIVIQTLHARNVFASLVARDSTYELLIGIWKISHPNLKSSINGVTLDDAGTGDKTEKTESHDSEDRSDEGSDDVYDEDAEDDEDMGSFTEAGANGSVAGSDVGDLRSVSRKTSAAPVSIVPQTNGTTPKGLENADAVVTGAAVSADFPGPPLHGPTECTEQDTHYDKPLVDTTIPAPLGKVYSMLFGPASGVFMRKWLVDEQKSKELSYEDDKTGLDDGHRTFVYSYIKPLNAPVGPKQTKCIVTSTLENFDLEKSVSIKQSTQTPDVPSGNIFTTKTKYCLMWGPGNSTRIIANCTIEWTGKSWLRGPIEKGANDGQTQYVKDIIAALKAAVTTKPPVRGAVRSKGKGKRTRETFDTAGTEAERAAAGGNKAGLEPNWGLLEPLRGPLGPVASLVQPLLSTQTIIAILLLLLAQSWFFGPRAGSSVGFPVSGTARYAAYETMWQNEEAALWDWLEDRIGLDQAGKGPLWQLREDATQRQKTMNKNRMSRRVADNAMDERQVDDAIRVTEEKLAALKAAVDRKKSS